MLRIRLHALPADNTDAVTELAKVFEILDDSGDVAPKKDGGFGPSKLRFRYLTLGFHDDES